MPDAKVDTDVAVVGGGAAGLSAAIYTARNELDTTLIDAGSPILRRNAHLENYPGFPAGVNARRLLDLMKEHADRAGVDRREGVVGSVKQTDPGGEAYRFEVEIEDGSVYGARYVVAATKNNVGYLDCIKGVGVIDRGKEFVDTEEYGRTGVDGLYAAGRLAEKPHQAIVAAGHGAEVGVAILEDDDQPFYHDWVAPDGYFTDRGRDLPPGCEEIDERDQLRRQKAGCSVMRSFFKEPRSDGQPTHPSLRPEE